MLDWLQVLKVVGVLILASCSLPIKFLQVAFADQILELSISLKILARLDHRITLSQSIFDLRSLHCLECAPNLDSISPGLRVADTSPARIKALDLLLLLPLIRA